MTAFRMADLSEWRPFGMADRNRVDRITQMPKWKPTPQIGELSASDPLRRRQ